MKKSICSLLLLALFIFPACQSRNTADDKRLPVTTVVWISVDGLRGDYVDRFHPPFLTSMLTQAAYSKHMQTIFPTITFASHTSEATGVYVSEHQIPANDFYDRVTDKKYAFPSDTSLLMAEPIWQTATREHLRVAVCDWPLSQLETGPNAPAYFGHAKYDGKETDEHRLQKMSDIYASDKNRQPLQLVMGYIEAMDKAGHKYGPDSPHIGENLLRVDGILSKTFDSVKATWVKHKQPGDLLYFLVTTDHGMSEVKTLVRLDMLLGIPREPTSTQDAETQPDTAPATLPAFGATAQHRDIITWTSGPVGNVFVSNTLDPQTREQKISDFLAKLRTHPYLTAYRQKDLPEQWHFRSDSRIGDIVLVLKDGYTFTTKGNALESPADDKHGPLGMHGYPAEENPKMDGFIMAWRSDGILAGKDLGTIQAIRFHATVCRWLHIEPAEGADTGSMGI